MSEFKGFVGPAYQASNIMQDNQALINWFVEMDGEEGAKVAKALLGAPGLSIVQPNFGGFGGMIRGFHVLPGGQSAMVAYNTELAILTIATPPGANARPTFTSTLVGGFKTSTGLVDMRDNGAGQLVVAVDGQFLYTYSLATGFFNTSTDPGFLGSYRVAEIDGWFIFLKPNSQTFYTSPLYWNGGTGIDPTYFALKDDYSDNAVTMIEQNRELWLIGETTTEVWYNAGGQFFPFSRLQGTMIQAGCAATNSISRYGQGLVWLGQSDRGNNTILMTEGYQVKNIATPALAYALNQYPVIEDAIGYCYSEEGHEFYVLTFPTADITWVYDFTTDMWHQRASFDPVTGQFHRQRANCMMNFQNMILVGDYQNANIYWQTRTAFSDGENPLVAVRRAPHLWDGGDRNRIRHNRLQIEFGQNSATQTGQGSNPQAMLRWSNDGGQTFGNEHYAAIGTAGKTTNRVMWRRLGFARDRVYEVRVSDPVSRDITGASLMVEGMGA